MSSVVYLKCQTPTVRIPCVAVSPDAVDNLHVTFKRYPTDVAAGKMKAFDAARVVKSEPLKSLSDLPDDEKADIDSINEAIRAANQALQDKAESEVATILFDEIVDIEGLQDSDGNAISYKDASDEDKAGIYRALNSSNPYILALIEGYNKALVNVGEARSKN